MDSGNSGSMQSSSGGDEEYDSRAESVPAFLNNPPSNHFGSMSNPPSLFPQHQNQHQPNLSDLSSNYFQAFSQSQAYSNPNSMLHLDHAVQPRGLRSDQPNCTDLGNLPGSSSSTQHHGPNQGSTPTARATTQPNVVRNSKKRTRASRRAPTTVLTTDTSNFRAMVQEFTGIPSPPFSGSSNSRRFDLFGNSSALRTGHLEPMGALYPLRPSPQKVQLSPFLSSSSSSCSSSSSSLLNNMVDATNSNHFSSTLHNYHQVPLGQIPRQPQNMLNMQNPILTFQPLSQTSLHPSFNVPGFGARSLDELGMSHGHVNVNLCELPQPNHGNDGGQDHLRSSDGNFGNSLRVGGGCKLNYSATSSSDFNHDKPLENVSTRGEGTVDSWLCPSD